MEGFGVLNPVGIGVDLDGAVTAIIEDLGIEAGFCPVGFGFFWGAGGAYQVGHVAFEGLFDRAGAAGFFGVGSDWGILQFPAIVGACEANGFVVFEIGDGEGLAIECDGPGGGFFPAWVVQRQAGDIG